MLFVIKDGTFASECGLYNFSVRAFTVLFEASIDRQRCLWVGVSEKLLSGEDIDVIIVKNARVVMA